MPLWCERCLDRLAIHVPATVIEHKVPLCDDCSDELAFEYATDSETDAA